MLKDYPEWLKNAPAGWAQQHGYTKPADPAPKAATKPDWVTDAEWSDMNSFKRFNDLTKFRNEYIAGTPTAPPSPRPESPYDIVGGGQYGNTLYPGMPRYKAEAERRKAEAEAARAEMELEYQRWMMEQMRRNPYGMNIRDLIYGAGK